MSLMAMGEFRAALCGVRRRLAGHLLAQRASVAANHLPQIERLYAAAGIEHERPPLDILPPEFVPPFDQFDRLVLSHEVGHMKPDRTLLRSLRCRREAFRASSCVFIDDLLENVEGARRAGLDAIPYVTTPMLID